MSVQNIHVQSNVVILDGVTFSVDFGDDRAVYIDSNHSSGPCFVCGSARAVLTQEHADKLVQAGITLK